MLISKTKKYGIALSFALSTLVSLTSVSTYAAVPTGFFHGRFERQEGSEKVGYDVDLVLRSDGERVFALQFENDGSKDMTWGLLLAVEEVDDGSLVFRKVFVDGTTPLPRVADEPTLIGRLQIRRMRGGHSEEELVMNFPATEGYPSYSYIGRRASNKYVWANYDSSHPFFGRARHPYGGELSGNPGRPTLSFNDLKATNDSVSVPCGVTGADLELVELFDGLYAARRVSKDLKQRSGLSLDQSLYGFVAPLWRDNGIETYLQMQILTFQAEACSKEMTPGTVASTRVVSFDNRTFF